MNGPHLAAGRLETGDVNLNTERSNNIDLTLDLTLTVGMGMSPFSPITSPITSTYKMR
nr:MAG: hypothetical protein CM15mP61_12310 [Gammaproteobacteria bacterium]